MGGGIGHRATDYIRQSVPEPTPKIGPKSQEEATSEEFADSEENKL
jgi:hypothetical protein